MSPHSRIMAFAAACVLAAGSAAAQSFEKLVDFRCETIGCAPGTTLVEGDDGFIYGTTSEGGATDRGTVFRMDRAGAVVVLRSPARSFFKASDGFFYGTTEEDGAFGNGTVYRMDRNGVVTELYAFDGVTGGSPTSLVQAADGLFYGTTAFGGAADSGIVFRMDPSGAVTVVRSFEDEAARVDPLAFFQSPDGFLYGTTYYGTVFRMDLAGAVTVLRTFDSIYVDMIEGSDGFFYGVTDSGGDAGAGTIFRMDRAGGTVVLHSFAGPDGAAPIAAPVEASDGFLYGLTNSGGAFGAGVLYRMDRAGGFAVLHTFDGASGAYGVASLIQAGDGALYGTVALGGAYEQGVAFRLSLAAPGRHIRVMAPHAGARWTIGSRQTIRWHNRSDRRARVRIELSRDGGSSWETLAENVAAKTPHTGHYRWLVTGPPAAHAVVRVTSMDGQAAGSSRGTFSIGQRRR